MIEWGQKSKPKKIAGPKFNPQKIPPRIFPSHKNLLTELHDWDYIVTIINLQIVLNTQKNPYLNQATPQKYLSNFSTLKKSQNWKFQTQKILQSSLSLEMQSTPPGIN